MPDSAINTSIIISTAGLLNAPTLKALVEKPPVATVPKGMCGNQIS